ncbi:MAG TPA: beta-L-arabinofuranosidase domain-containing protein [Devosia sp.]|nr:beta-L-arabinofuranosidase domain-containing protein [Devosia sp.]
MKHAQRLPLDWLVPAARPDDLTAIETTLIDPGSYLGERVAGNLKRLNDVDLEARLAGFRNRPGEHPWIGEHIGKWLHAASITWTNTGDAKLRARLDYAASALIATQEPNGYLGTYAVEKRFGAYPEADWDVWSHKYCIIGLLAYYRATGADEALRCARRAADLIVSTFSGPSGRKALLGAGTHMGMAATSILEPMVLLYRHTAERRYFAFAEEILVTWDEQGGPRVLSTLLETGRVSEVGNGKAYEMLSNILGLVEFARVLGNDAHLAAAIRAWDDVVAHHLYITGTASFGEHFHNQNELPDSTSVNMGETCVTVTWLQLTLALLGLTGETRFAEEVERTTFNQLPGAQLRDGSAWCYYVPLHGYRNYGSGITCCISSGPRGMALVPGSILWTDRAASELIVAQYQSARAVVRLGGQDVTVSIDTIVPYRGDAKVTFTMMAEAKFGLRLRKPRWAAGFRVMGTDAVDEGGWVRIAPRIFRSGETLTIRFDIGQRKIEGTAWNAGRVAMSWGPLVLAYQSEDKAPSTFDSIDPRGAPLDFSTPHAENSWSVLNPLGPAGRRAVRISSFAEIGPRSHDYKVWIDREPTAPRLSVFHGAVERLSSGDLARGSASDYDRFTFAATDKNYEQSWFALEAAAPVTFSRVEFTHGRSLIHGGWFDASQSKPEIQIRETSSAEWRTIARIEGYPETDAEHDGGLKPGQTFVVGLPSPVTATGLRVRGTGSFGEYPPGRFATCGELQAFS